MKVKKTRVIAAFIVLIALAVGLWRDATEKVESATESRDAVSEKESIEEAREIASTNTAPEAEIGSSEEKADAIEPSAATNAVKISYKKVDKSIPRLRQAATANRLYIAPESGRLVEEKFAATQEPSARGTVPYVLIPTSEIDDIHHERLASMGVRELGYFPPNGILVELTEDQFNAIAKDEMFSLVGEWSASDKIEPHVARQFDREELTLTVVTCKESDKTALAETVVSLGGEVVRGGCDGNGWLQITLPVDDAKLSSLAAHGEVHWIEPFEKMRFVNNFAVRTTDMNVTPVWNTHGLTGTNQVVAVCDSGIDTGVSDTVVEDFRGRILAITDYGGKSTADYGGHGTHVAGSFFGNGALSQGYLKGIAYEAKAVVFTCGGESADDDYLYFDKLIPSQYDQWYGSVAWKKAFTTDIATYKYRIHSNSWGSSANDGTYTVTSRGADEAAVEHPYLLVSIAAGNMNTSGAVMASSPGTSKNALTVGNCYTSYMSSYGKSCSDRNSTSCYDTADGRFKPDLMASGTNIGSTKSTVASSLGNHWDVATYSYYTNYTTMTGTSMATPIASGCATLTRQWLVEKCGLNEPSSALIKAVLTGGARGSQPTSEQGWGAINLEESLYPSKANTFVYDYITNSTAKAKLVGSFTITNSAAPFKAQLAWIDPAATSGASTTLVVDHDLIVSNITQNIGYAGNDFTNDGVMTFDTVNNVEGVRISSPSVGDVYNVYIVGKTTSTNQKTVPALYVSAAAVDSAVDLAYHANISKATATWSTKDGITDGGGATLKGTSEDVIQLTNTVGNATVDFGSGITAGSIAFLGSGTVELLCSGTPNVGTISAGSGLDAINLNNNLWPNTSFNIPDGVLLRYNGDSPMSAFPWAADNTPCTVAIACQYDESSELLKLGGGTTVQSVQNYIIEEGATITAPRFTTGAGQYVTTHITQTGGSVQATGDGDSTAESGNAILLGHWRSTASYNLQGGMLSAPNGMLRFGWDGTVTASVGGGSSAATMSAKSMLLGHANSDYGRTVEVRVLENGVLDVGSGGITTAKSTAVLYLAGGTLKLADGATADMTTSALTVSSASTIQSDGEATITGSVTGSGSIHIAAGTIAFPGILSSNPMTIADGAKVKIPLTSGQAALENVLLFSTTQTQEQLDGKIILVDSTTGDELDNTFVVSNGMVLLRNAVVEPLSGTVYLNGADYVAKMTANGYSVWLYSKAYEGDRHYIVTNLTEGYYAHIEKVPSKGIRLVLVKDKPEALWAGDFSSARQDFGDWVLLPNGNTVNDTSVAFTTAASGGVIVSNKNSTIDLVLGMTVATTFSGVAENTTTNQALVTFSQYDGTWSTAGRNDTTGSHIATDGYIKGVWLGSQYNPTAGTPVGSVYPTDGGTHGYLATYSKELGTKTYLDGGEGFAVSGLKASDRNVVSASIGGMKSYPECNMAGASIDNVAVFTNVTFDATTAGTWRSYSVTVSNVTAGTTLEGVYDVLKLTGGEVTIDGTVCARAIDITGNVTLKGETNSCLRASAICIASDATVTFSCTASEAATVTVMDGRIVNGSKVTGSISGGSCATTATRDLVTIAFTPTTGATLHFGATDDGESLTVGSSTVAELVEVEGVTESNVDSVASNGLRVWQNAVLGITPADTTADEITLSITMNGSTPVVSTASGSLTTLTIDSPTTELNVGEIKATATLQQADAPNAADTDWTVAVSTTATKKFYRILVKFETETN